VRFLFFLIFLLGCSEKFPAPYSDVTHKYDLPPEMKGAKIYVLGGEWSGVNPIWVVLLPEGETKLYISPAR